MKSDKSWSEEDYKNLFEYSEKKIQFSTDNLVDEEDEEHDKNGNEDEKQKTCLQRLKKRMTFEDKVTGNEFVSFKKKNKYDF